MLPARARKALISYGFGCIDHASLAMAEEHAFHQQIATLLIIEFAVIFHSVIIGLGFGCDDPALVFHCLFEA